LRKVVWPSRQDTLHLTVVVLIVASIIGAALGGLDLGFAWLAEHVLLR
jgi:preprotein translocase subunit SecE